MTRQRELATQVLLGSALVFVLPILLTGILGLLLPEFRFPHVPLHTLIEGTGGFTALAIAAILLIESRKTPVRGYYIWLASGLLSMGILDLFHAASMPGNHFVWLHSIAMFSGGSLFALVWKTNRFSAASSDLRFPAVAAIAALIAGVISLISAKHLPLMSREDGYFSALALSLNGLGGIGFSAAALYFIRRYTQNYRLEDLIFATQSGLFGTAGLLFGCSTMWDVSWWWWHLVRLGAYLAALSFGLRTFINSDRDLQLLNRQLHAANAALDQTVEERTARLRASEERFELAVRGSTDGIWDWNVLTDEVYYSPRMKELIGYSDAEFADVFNSFETRLHPEDHDWVMREVKEHLLNRKPYDVKYRLQVKSGEYRWFRARGQAIWNASGQASRMAGSITDVTEEHRLRERFRLAVEASPTALLMLCQNGRILMANSRSLSLFGYLEAELLGQAIDLLIPDQVRPDRRSSSERFWKNPDHCVLGTNLELNGVRKDGLMFPVKVGLSPVETADGPAIICGVIDVTDQHRALEAMRHAKDAAESSSRAKSSFLANMSHEIRTPMNGIIGMAQLLAQTELRSYQRDYLTTIEESALILLRLLNDILDFSKIEAGKLELESVNFRLSECVARASQMLMLRAAEKGLEIACRVSLEIPEILRGDSGRVQQVLANLLSNAVKFTECGEIFVNVNPEAIEHDRVRIHFSVSDTGIGISADKLDQIFRPFEQAEASTTRRFGGTGLGLTISRQLVEMMHGRMWVDSEPGRGSTFHFTAELGIATEQRLHEPAELASLQDLPVLVVDDNLTNRRILSEMLQYWRMKPVPADSAAAARRALQKARDDRNPIQLILLDHHMPGEDGFHFAKTERDRSNSEMCPIIMISSGVLPIDSELYRNYGIGRFMTKPVIASELLEEVLHQFGRQTTEGPTLNNTIVETSEIHPRRVLLVEDNEINRRVALGLLRSRSHQVVIAENGQEALHRLVEQDFDVVLMDMQMPIMDGYEATASIRQSEANTDSHIPIVAMTAEALKGDRERCLSVGMDDYVSKPITPAELYRVVEQFPAKCLSLENSIVPLNDPAQFPSAAQPETSKAQIHPPHHVLAPSSNKLGQIGAQPVTKSPVDWNLALRRVGGSASMLHELSDLVKLQTPTQLADIRRAIESRDPRQLRRSAHTIKGSVNYFGAEPLIQAALALENCGRIESFEDVEELLTTLECELTRVLAALDLGPPDTFS